MSAAQQAVLHLDCGGVLLKPVRRALFANVCDHAARMDETSRAIPPLLREDEFITAGKSLRFSETSASASLDALRGIAALLVLLDHWRNALFVDFQQIHDHRMLLAPIYLLCAVGHQAVVIFFVLSGFLISGSIIRAFKSGLWHWPRYLTQRLVRLWIVLLPALVLGALWDNLGIYLHHAPKLYSGISANHMSVNVQSRLSIADLIGNAAFLQSIVVPEFGSNGALWSLANEFWYYMLFPLAACILGRVYQNPVKVVACAIFLCLIGILITQQIWLLFPVWLLGASLHWVPRRPTTLWARVLACVAYAAIFFGDTVLDHRGWSGTGPLGDLMLGIATVGLVWVLLGAMNEAKPSRARGVARTTAKFSYTLYVANTPLLTLLVSIAVGDTRWVPAARSGCLAFGILVIVIAYAWVLAVATEFNTEKVRARVEGYLLGSPKAVNHRPASSTSL